ncbi:hypothetical protein CHARACLAT_010520 [Characodon lateralis]|uniref:Uncharacterized protein n=1 Tax=Characodon lateralis TaxID=208331 RepID=A0ABU7E8L9_9TELE|nr:hypothetical protein [Characodon lateralis]
MVFPVSLKPHQGKHQNELCSVNRNPESLNPWRPDCIYLLEIHSFMFLITCCTRKPIILLIFVLRNVLLYVGQICSENNDIFISQCNFNTFLTEKIRWRQLL